MQLYEHDTSELRGEKFGASKKPESKQFRHRNNLLTDGLQTSFQSVGVVEVLLHAGNKLVAPWSIEEQLLSDSLKRYSKQ